MALSSRPIASSSRLVAILVIGAALLAPHPAIPQATSPAPSNVAESALPSVVTLRIYDAAGTQLGLGSGFFLEDGRIATNRHVVEGASWVEVYDHEGQLLGTAPYAEAISSHLDLAVLPALGGEHAPGLPLASEPPRVGETVWVIGSPEGLTGSVSSGVVSARRTLDDQTLLQISAPISPGSSGGPVLDASGRVIGIAASILEEGQNLNFAVPVHGLVALAGSPAGHLGFPAAQRAGSTSTARSSSSNLTDEDMEEMLSTAEDLAVPFITEGRLGPDDWTYDGKPVDFYRFTGRRGQVLTLAMSSSEFDTHVGIFQLGDTDGGGWSQSNDDIAQGITDSRLTVTLPSSAAYLVVVTSYDGSPGRYSLSVTEGRAAERSDGRWRYLGLDSDSTRWSWDSRSLARTSSHYVSVWARLEPRRPTSDPGVDRYDKETILYDYDCDAPRFRVRSYVYYLQNRVVDSGDIDAPDWRHVPPGSVGEALLEAVCRF